MRILLFSCWHFIVTLFFTVVSQIVTATTFQHGDVHVVSNALLNASAPLLLKTETCISVEELQEFEFRDDRNERDEAGAVPPPTNVNHEVALVFVAKEAKVCIHVWLYIVFVDIVILMKGHFLCYRHCFNLRHKPFPMTNSLCHSRFIGEESQCCSKSRGHLFRHSSLWRHWITSSWEGWNASIQKLSRNVEPPLQAGRQEMLIMTMLQSQRRRSNNKWRQL